VALGDRDFCTPSHRRKFHDRLKRALQQVVDPSPDSTSTADFIQNPGSGLSVLDSSRPSTFPIWTPTASLSVSARALSGPILKPSPPELPEGCDEMPAPQLQLQPVIPNSEPQPADPLHRARSVMQSRLGSIRADLQSKRHRLAQCAAG
jgi:hypothetical protein